MRLDKFICESTELTRSLAKRALHRGDVTCDGVVVKNSGFKVLPQMAVHLDGTLISIIGERYIMLNKPVDTICSTIDEDTTGLVLITSDGQWSHKITSPKKDCGKRYLVELAEPIDASLIQVFADGVELRNEDGLTKPALLDIIDPTHVRLTISEGKYHQVKRMFAAVGNRVVNLHREAVGGIELNTDLAAGEWRFLTAAEVKSV